MAVLDYSTVVGKDLLESLIIRLYSDPRTIFREYVQNACDSIYDAVKAGVLSSIDEGHVVIDINAAKKCGCHEFIMGLENGYDTKVGGAGGHLSGGERQRICIARAMLKNAPVVILDEATAYTDPENEAVIQESVAKLVKGKTLIVIAHRLSTIVDADKIFVVNRGNLEAVGKHDELLRQCELYKNMWEAHTMVKDEDADKSAMAGKEILYV